MAAVVSGDGLGDGGRRTEADAEAAHFFREPCGQAATVTGQYPKQPKRLVGCTHAVLPVTDISVHNHLGIQI